MTARNGAETLEYLFYDLFFKTITGKISDTKSTSSISVADQYDPYVIIVDIDEPSLAKLGNYNTWDRSIHADAVNALSDGGASAIGFDILFKKADFGKQKANQSLQMLNLLQTNMEWENLYPQIKAFYNYDSMLVSAVKKSRNVIVCFDFAEKATYKHETQWEPLSTPDRAESIGFSSTFSNGQIDSINNIEAKDLLDNIFPELAQAAAQIGSVNAYPDDDGVVRRVSLLYKFPNPFINPEEPNPAIYSRTYTTMSLMTILHLFHQKPENVKIKMGQYIDIGRPLGIYRDKDGEFHTTYPHFSYPMFKSLLSFVDKLNSIPQSKEKKEEIIDISSKIVATKDSNGNISFEIFEGQILSHEFSKIIQNFDTLLFTTINDDEERNLTSTIAIKRDLNTENTFILRDLQTGEDISFNPYIVNTIKYFSDSLNNLPPNEPLHISMDMDVRYDYPTKQWKSNLVILSDDVIRDILRTPVDSIKNLKPGEEIRFGNVKHIPIDQRGRYLVNYQGRYNTAEVNRPFQHISYYDVVKGRIDPGFYQGKIFILGSAATAMFDVKSGPHEENYPGVLVHANIIQNILNNKFLTILNEHSQQMIVILLALICTLLGLFIKSYLSIIISVILMTIYIFISYHYFSCGIYIGVSKQLLAIVLTNIAALIIQFYFENKEKNFLNNAFKQYISPELIDEMVTNEIKPTLGGTKSNITAFFTDIASFSTFSEKIGDPKKLVDLLNEYLTAMTDILLKNKGTLDKYEGDAIIAFFGAPMPLKNHAQNACETAIEMQKKLKELRIKWNSQKADKNNVEKWPRAVREMHMRIGINSGDIVTGNMGSDKRMNYTMMGDAVNLASRLESAAKQYGACIHISEDTFEHLDQSKFIYRTLDTIRVIGKSRPVTTYELLDYKDGQTSKEDKQNLDKLITLWNLAREAYLNMEWDKAKDLFTQCLDYEPHHPDKDPGSRTTPSQTYIKRCVAYKLNPPVSAGEIWDGVFTATEK